MEAFQHQLDEDLKKYLAEAKGDWAEVVDLSKKNGIANKTILRQGFIKNPLPTRREMNRS